jgi:hypothetical protein
MKTLKTVLPDKITAIEEAKQYLTDLYKNNESYHPEDGAADCLDIDSETGARMDELMEQVYSFANEAFDPCMFVLELDPTYKGMEE